MSSKEKVLETCDFNIPSSSNRAIWNISLPDDSTSTNDKSTPFDFAFSISSLEILPDGIVTIIPPVLVTSIDLEIISPARVSNTKSALETISEKFSVV